MQKHTRWNEHGEVTDANADTRKTPILDLGQVCETVEIKCVGFAPNQGAR